MHRFATPNHNPTALCEQREHHMCVMNANAFQSDTVLHAHFSMRLLLLLSVLLVSSASPTLLPPSFEDKDLELCGSKYNVKEKIGEGGFGSVHRTLNSENSD